VAFRCTMSKANSQGTPRQAKEEAAIVVRGQGGGGGSCVQVHYEQTMSGRTVLRPSKGR